MNVDKVLVPVWSQMAAHYRSRSNLLHYEILNEPHGITDVRWSQIQQQVINAIRAVDRFEIVSEYHDFVGMQFWFGEIRITKPPGVR